jgi:hypothetical protein
MDDAGDDADSLAEEATKWVISEHSDELKAVQDGVCEILNDYRERLEALSKELDGELKPFKERMKAVRQAIQGEIDAVPEVFELPEHPEIEIDLPDETAWLFDSSRDYLEQIGVYKARRALVGNNECMEQVA